MAKLDFCFTFYDGDATRDTAHMNRLERGAYFDLFIQLRQRGRLSIDDMKKFLSRDFDAVWPALEWILKQDEDGYYIEWLENSIQKATKHSKRQAENVQNRYQKDEKNYKSNESVVPKNDSEIPLGNGYGDGIEGIEGGTGEEREETHVPRSDTLIGQMKAIWMNNFPAVCLLPDDTLAFYPLAKLIQKWKAIRGSPTDVGPMDEILAVWQDVSLHCSQDKHLSTYSPSRVLKYFSSITQSMTSNARSKTHERSHSTAKSAGASELLASLQDDLRGSAGA